MFTDTVSVKIIAGRGGHGIVCWRREKYIPKGGPTGGNGGWGGNVIIRGDENILSLDEFRSKRLLKAKSGQSGGPNQRQGRRGPDLIIKVPLGTLVKDLETGEILFDITEHGQSEMLAEGGRGGRGNASFKTSIKQAPNYCTQGAPGQEMSIQLELKIIADVGLVGFPNAGKSTLINSLTKAHAKCDAYPFTTLFPNMGFIQTDDYMSYSIADIPGIIEGAHENKGLGLQFLKHIERTKVLFFILDASSEDPIHDYEVLISEIKAYNPEILDKPSLILLNKCDLVDPSELKETLLSKVYQTKILEISAQEKINLESVRKELFKLMDQAYSLASQL